MRRPALPHLVAALAACVAVIAAPAHAVGRLVDVRIVDRTTGETLTPVLHDGTWWIAGKPGTRYGVELVSRTGARTLSVVAVDGVNAISGDDAVWNQTGYVLDGYGRTEIAGWRKSLNQVAAFEFTALPDSYAARTGRPANVGVIGIATFSERPRLAPVTRPRAAASDAAVPEPDAALPAPPPAMPKPSAEAPSAVERSAQAEYRAPALGRLGTGHGQIEESSIRYVAFRRAGPTPNEVVTIRYDLPENLVAMGILPAPGAVAAATTPNPFPGNGRFVADPPPR